MKYLITGGSGFLGQHIAETFSKLGLEFKTTVRANAKTDQIATGDLIEFSDWNHLFKDVDILIHAAAKAHDMRQNPNLKQIYHSQNYDLTLKLAEEAKKNGVKKFIFISTIKVNGELTTSMPFKADDLPQPTDDYGISKHLAELALLQLRVPNSFEVVIIRPCLIYGRGVKANFANLMNLVRKNYPLPFGAIHNLRSFVSVDNLIDLILVVSRSKGADGEILLVSDDQDLSLTELIQNLAKAQNVKPWLVPVPIGLLKSFLWLVGRSSLSLRLFSNLQVDIQKTKTLLGWKPPHSFEDSIKKMLS